MKIWELVYQQFGVLSAREKRLVAFVIESCARVSASDELKTQVSNDDSGGQSWQR